MTTKHYVAPRKIVAWGEYAVLAGAPARVLAVDRLARVSITPAENVFINAMGFTAPRLEQNHLNFSKQPVASLVETILQAWGYQAYPCGLRIEIDSRDFYQDQKKLGLGSSAAVCVALYRGLAELLAQEAHLSQAMQIHRQFQQGSGSGMDIATSWYGQTIRFQSDGDTRPEAFDPNISLAVVFTGNSASTPKHLASFAKWRAAGDTATLDALVKCSTALDEQFTSASLATYIQALKALDNHAQLNIFTPMHQQLHNQAHDLGLQYKPCGAGGGDIGMAFGFPGQEHAMQQFRHWAEQNCTLLDVNLSKSD